MNQSFLQQLAHDIMFGDTEHLYTLKILDHVIPNLSYNEAYNGAKNYMRQCYPDGFSTEQNGWEFRYYVCKDDKFELIASIERETR